MGSRPSKVSWGLASLVLALLVSVLDWISSAPPRALPVVLSLLGIGVYLCATEALGARRDDRPGSPDDADR